MAGRYRRSSAARKSPTVGTVERLARAVGLEAAVAFHTPMTREEQPSLALHRAIAARLEAEPARVLAQAKRNLVRMRDVQLPRWCRSSPTPTRGRANFGT